MGPSKVPSKVPSSTMSCTISVFGSLCRTKSMHRTVHLTPLVQAHSVPRNWASHASRDGVVRRMAQDPCVIHSKLTSMHATKQDVISYWTNNKDNQTRLSARFEHASHCGRTARNSVLTEALVFHQTLSTPKASYSGRYPLGTPQGRT